MIINFDQFEVLSFDCYGTLIDWETGILTALNPLLRAKGVELSDAEILELYAEIEPEVQQKEFQNYKTVLASILAEFGKRLTFNLSPDERTILQESLKTWPPFPDTNEMLARLKRKYRLAIISNIDDDLFRHSNKLLQVDFDWIITAEQARSYKPSLNNFYFAINKIGIPKEKILHVAQSIFHDIIPAKAIGLTTVWVNRRQNRAGSGATKKAMAQPDLEVPDLRSLVELMEDQP